jgi:hypothetical protein
MNFKPHKEGLNTERAWKLTLLPDALIRVKFAIIMRVFSLHYLMRAAIFSMISMVFSSGAFS